jgi:hypothetical protein
MKVTPLGVCKFVMMTAITIFILFLVITSLVRILCTPIPLTNNEESDKVNKMSIDILIQDPISIDIKSIGKNQDEKIRQGMSILVVQGTDMDGLYSVDIDQDLVRIDCVKNYIEYQIEMGKNKQKKYKWEENHNVGNNIWRTVIQKESSSILLREDMAEVLLFFQEHVKEVELEFSNIYCNVKIVNRSKEKAVTLKAKLQKQEWILETNKTYQGDICNNTLTIQNIVVS